MNASVLVLGSVNRDLIAHAPRLPLPGETLRGHHFVSSLGGKGANQAVAAARLGAQVRLIARVGRLDGGEELLAALRREGVDVTRCQQPDAESPGVALIVVGADSGENQIVTVAGSNATLRAESLDSLPLSGVQWLVAQQELPIEALDAAFRHARAAGGRVLLNAAPFREEARRLLPLVDVLVVNEGEAAALLGAPVSAPVVADAAERLLALGPRAVLISLGSAGVQWQDGKQRLHRPARQVRAVDTVGAGDTLVGALVTALGEGHAIDAALDFAQAAAAWAVSRPGVQAAMPRRAELDAWRGAEA
ncbi:ribokinase [Inhella gelatinilytica]|nr:ribokinase [Inhella gelatinilytica]